MGLQGQGMVRGDIKLRELSGGTSSSGNDQGRHQAQGMVKGDIMVRGASRSENGQGGHCWFTFWVG